MEAENSPTAPVNNVENGGEKSTEDKIESLKEVENASAVVENGKDADEDSPKVEKEVVENGDNAPVNSSTTPPVSPIKVDTAPPAGDRTSSPPVSPAKSPTIRLAPVRSTESHDNPFLADGDLSKKAETIIRCSTISRTELKVFDPDTTQPEPEPAVEEPAVQAKTAGATNAAAPRPQDVNVKQNGNVEDALTPQSVEVEVGKANASQPEAQKAEEVKVEKDKKCACCVVQ